MKIVLSVMVLCLFAGFAVGVDANKAVIRRAVEMAFDRQPELASTTAWELVEPLPTLPQKYDSVTVQPFTIERSGKPTIWLQAWHQGRRGKTLPVKLEVIHTGKIVRVIKPVKSGDALSGAIEIIASEWKRNGNPLPADNAEKLIATRPLTPGDVLEVGWARQPYIVHRNDAVTVLSDAKSFSVEVEGTAMMNGKIGDRIPVKTLANKTIWGKVIGSGKVRA